LAELLNLSRITHDVILRASDRQEAIEYDERFDSWPNGLWLWTGLSEDDEEYRLYLVQGRFIGLIVPSTEPATKPTPTKVTNPLGNPLGGLKQAVKVRVSKEIDRVLHQ
jgi:hypothetical protein